MRTTNENQIKVSIIGKKAAHELHETRNKKCHKQNLNKFRLKFMNMKPFYNSTEQRKSIIFPILLFLARFKSIYDEHTNTSARL